MCLNINRWGIVHYRLNYCFFSQISHNFYKGLKGLNFLVFVSSSLRLFVSSFLKIAIPIGNRAVQKNTKSDKISFPNQKNIPP